jgi:DNA-binding response OmpR family regulator
MTRALIVENEPQVAELLDEGLAESGYATEICDDGEAALRAAERDFDLVILDLGMPDVDGEEFLRRLRERGEDPLVLIVRDRDGPPDPDDARRGSEAQGTKPLDLEDLLAGVRARAQPDDDQAVVEAAGITLDVRTCRAHVDDGTVQLTPRECALLEAFMRSPGQILSNRQLLEAVWGPAYGPVSNLVQVYVGYLRRKLGAQRIETVRGLGYRLRRP